MLVGGRGVDLIVSLGDDRILYQFGDGYDVVLGFDGYDMLQLCGYVIDDFEDLCVRLVQDGGDVWFDLGQGDSIMFCDMVLLVFDVDSFDILCGDNVFGVSVFDLFICFLIEVVGMVGGFGLQ